MEERRDEVEATRKEICESKSILCIGAGSTGIEAAAYIKDKFPEKRVAVCQRGQKLLTGFHGSAHDTIMPMMEQIGVEVLTGVNYSDDAPIANEFDYKLDCRGYKFEGPRKFLQDDLKDCVDRKTG